MPDNAITAVKNSRLKLYRYFSQAVFLALLGQWSFYGLFRCPFVVPFVSCSSCPVITCWGRISSLFWGFWLLLPVSAVLFGRSFCGWACPGGLVSQLLVKISPFSKRFRFDLNAVAALGMYLALGVSLYIWLGLDNPRGAIPIRTGGFFESVKLTFAHADRYWLVRTYIVLGLLVLGLSGTMIWCRWACPTGGILEVVRRFSLFKVWKTSACNDCDQCRRVCNMKTRPDENNCTNCGDCINQCPVGAIRNGN